jgi:membrane-associated protease RseP (regulator of RpoE activity)
MLPGRSLNYWGRWTVGKRLETRRASSEPHLSRRRTFGDRRWLAAAALLALGAMIVLAQWLWPFSPGAASLVGSRRAEGAAAAGAEHGGPQSNQPGSATQPSGGSVGGAAVSPEQQQRQGTKLSRGLSAHTGGGITVDEAPLGTVTQELGLEPGDVIVSVNGTPMNSPGDFARIYLEQGRPRQIEAIRDGRPFHRHP